MAKSRIKQIMKSKAINKQAHHFGRGMKCQPDLLVFKGIQQVSNIILTNRNIFYRAWSNGDKLASLPTPASCSFAHVQFDRGLDRNGHSPYTFAWFLLPVHPSFTSTSASYQPCPLNGTFIFKIHYISKWWR